MSDLLIPLIDVVMMLLDLFKWAVIIAIILGWLVTFNVVNMRNRAVYMVMDVVTRITEPVLRPIRRIMPNTGAIDFSPIALFLIIYLIQSYLGVLARRL